MILEVRGGRFGSPDLYGKNLLDAIATEPLCVSLSNLADINYDERMNPIDFFGQKSKVKVAMDIHGNNFVDTMETEPFCASSLNWLVY